MEKILKLEQITSILKELAHTTVRSEIVCEHFLSELGVSRDEIGAKVREVDRHLSNESLWQNRFPALFSDDIA